MRHVSDTRALACLVRDAQREREFNALCAMGLTPREQSVMLDKFFSMSALVEVEDLYAFVTDDMIRDQEERYLNGTS